MAEESCSTECSAQVAVPPTWPSRLHASRGTAISARAIRALLLNVIDEHEVSRGTHTGASPEGVGNALQALVGALHAFESAGQGIVIALINDGGRVLQREPKLFQCQSPGTWLLVWGGSRANRISQ
mmetsp:Transcript_8973/g.21246  ORF Transcript_8973/g.21246 Transcript_8973/m.21246 type:complete len:126 (-) Transcript_8973:1198-1575(-)